MIKSIAKKFNLREKLLETELDKSIKNIAKTQPAEARTFDKLKSESDFLPEISDLKMNNPALYNLEKEVIVLLFEGQKEITKFISQQISTEDFTIEAHKRLTQIAFDKLENEETVDASKLIDSIKDEKLEAYVREITFEKHTISSNWEERNPGMTPEKVLRKFTKDTLLKFKLYKIDQQIKDNHQKISSSASDEEALRFMAFNKELEAEKKFLKESFSEMEIE